MTIRGLLPEYRPAPVIHSEAKPPPKGRATVPIAHRFRARHWRASVSISTPILVAGFVELRQPMRERRRVKCSGMFQVWVGDVSALA
jgi:hypothetical protein